MARARFEFGDPVLFAHQIDEIEKSLEGLLGRNLRGIAEKMDE
jgi:hypothetical protein